MPAPPAPPGYLDLFQIAEDLGIPYATASQRRYRGSDEIPPMVNMSGRWSIKAEDYDAWKRSRPAREAAARAASLLEEAERLRTQAAVLEREALTQQSA